VSRWFGLLRIAAMTLVHGLLEKLVQRRRRGVPITSEERHKFRITLVCIGLLLHLLRLLWWLLLLICIIAAIIIRLTLIGFIKLKRTDTARTFVILWQLMIVGQNLVHVLHIMVIVCIVLWHELIAAHGLGMRPFVLVLVHLKQINNTNI